MAGLPIPSPSLPKVSAVPVPVKVNIPAGTSLTIRIDQRVSVKSNRSGDGFTGEIKVELKDAPKGFKLNGDKVPENQDQARLTLTAPGTEITDPFELHLQGSALIGGAAGASVGALAGKAHQASRDRDYRDRPY